MTLWRSGAAPDWRDWAFAGMIGWFWSVPVGLVLWGVAVAVGQMSAEAALIPMAASLFLLFAPAFSWLGLVLALPVAVAAARRGLFGPASAALIGATAGGMAAGILGGTDARVVAAFGAVTLVLIWAALRLIRR